MTGQVPTKLRLVRCPKCRRLLPELPNVPVYQCGGCSTVLEAKKQKVVSKDVAPIVTESVTVNSNELQSISFDKEIENLSREETLPLKGHHPVETNCHTNQTEIQVCNEEPPMDVESSPEISTNFMHQGKVEKTSDVDEDKCFTKDTESSTRFCKESMHHENLQSTPERDEYITKDAYSSTETLEEQIHHRSLSSTPDVDMYKCVSGDVETLSGYPEELVNDAYVVTNPDSPDIDKDECSPNQINGDDENKNDQYREKPHRRVSFSDEIICSTELDDHLGHDDDEYETDLEPSSGSNQRESSAVVETNIISNEYERNRNLFENLPRDGSLREIVPNHDHQSSLAEELEQSCKRKSFYNREHMSSIDTLDNIVALRDMPESPMTRSYYGLGGSGSSCDETNDQVSVQNFHRNNRNIEDRQVRTVESLVGINEISNKIRGNSKVQDHNGYFSSNPSGNRAHHGLPRYGNKIETIEHQSRVPSYPHGHRIGYSDGNYLNDEMNTNFNLPNKHNYLEVEKMELLKKVRELQDELSRTYIAVGKQSENFSTLDQNRVHQYPDEFMHSQEFGRYHEGNSGPYQSKFSWNSFSSKATTSRNEVDYVYSQYPNQPNKHNYLEVEKMELLKKVRELQDELSRTCIAVGKQSENFSTLDQNRVHQYPDEFMHSQEFGRYHEGNSGPHLSKFAWNSFSSEATTSRNEVDYVYPQYPNQPISNMPLHSYDDKPDTSKLCSDNNDPIKLHAERIYLGKKHVLPVAGAASFLLCYGCSEVLQMPADFLLFKRRYHKLKCNSCSAILMFSFLKGNHIVRYMDHSSKGLSQIKPVSVDDHEPSLCKSFSTEEMPSTIDPQFDGLKRNVSGKNPSMGMKGNTFSNFVKSLRSIRSSSRRSKAESSSSEMEEVPASTTSPLHRLMGYHSATYLLKS